MIEIFIAFIYFDSDTIEMTKEIEKEIKFYNDNYLNYALFCQNYLIFSDYKLSIKEANIIIKFIEDDNGLNLLYGDGINTEYATYKIFQGNFENNLIKEENKSVDDKNIEELKVYVDSLKIHSEITELKKENVILINENTDYKNKINEVKKIVCDYKDLVEEKNGKINELIETNQQLNNYINKIPKIFKKIFFKQYKQLEIKK